MIKVFNSAYRNSEERWLEMSDVNVVTQGICEFTARPYILFEHRDYPLGALKAEYMDNNWYADLC